MTVCPQCGSLQEALPRQEGGPRRDLARVSSVAEAGYLVSLLESAGLAATTRPTESFNAVTGAWASTHVISIAEADVPIATRLLSAEASGVTLEATTESSGGHENLARPVSVNPWRMLTVLAVIASVGMLLALDTLDVWPQPGRPADRGDAVLPPIEPESQLGSVLRQQPGPFYADNGKAGGRRRLVFSERGQLWTLSIDKNRDGRYETHRRFAPLPPVAEKANDQ